MLFINLTECYLYSIDTDSRYYAVSKLKTLYVIVIGVKQNEMEIILLTSISFATPFCRSDYPFR